MPLAVSAPVDWLPEIDLAPDHAPEAEQNVAFDEDQVSIDAPPLVTDVGFAANDTVGRFVAAVGPCRDSSTPMFAPPHPDRARVASTAAEKNIAAKILDLIFLPFIWEAFVGN